MVAKIITGKSLRGALHYNENKVIKGKAELIGQSGFHMEINQLKFKDKLQRLENLSYKNTRTKTNTLHVSLNFAVGEKLSKQTLTAIAKDYMNGIGFEKQPYLVYQHRDAGHEHIHIVSTNIKADGSRISLHNLGRTKSEITRKSIEKEYGLVPAESQKKHQEQKIRKVEYGKCETKRAISNVVKGVISNYKFTSIPEMNAVLNRYNVMADRGAKESRMFAKDGLIYWALDKKGLKTGVPIKASSIYGSPTLKKLQLRFEKNKEIRKAHKEVLKSSLDKILMTKASKPGFELAMAKRNIEAVFRINPEGRLYGVTFVDHNTKCVFKGSDLGKGYSAASFEKYFEDYSRSKELSTLAQSKVKADYPLINSNHQTLIESLLQPEFTDGTTFKSLQQKFGKKKKRKRSIS